MTVAADPGRLSLGEVRGRLAAALAPLTDDDPNVIDHAADAVHPPAIMLFWDDPWLSPQTFRAVADRGYIEGRMEVILIASRVDPRPGIETLEELVAYVVGRLQADPYSWTLESASAPRVLTIAKVTYLGARLVYTMPVSV